jgi:hypothetical protein
MRDELTARATKKARRAINLLAAATLSQWAEKTGRSAAACKTLPTVLAKSLVTQRLNVTGYLKKPAPAVIGRAIRALSRCKKRSRGVNGSLQTLENGTWKALNRQIIGLSE